MATAAVANPTTLAGSSHFTTTPAVVQHRMSSFPTGSGVTVPYSTSTAMAPAYRPSQTYVASGSTVPPNAMNVTATFQNNYNTTNSTTALPTITTTNYEGRGLPAASISYQQQQLPISTECTQVTAAGVPGAMTRNVGSNFLTPGTMRQAGPSASYTTTTTGPLIGTSYQPGGAVVSTTSQAATQQEIAIQSAIMQGKIYSPPGAIYVPGSAATRAGIQTLYDAHMVPTFEATLTFPTSQQLSFVTGGGYEQQPSATNRGVEGVEVYPHKASKIVFPQKRSACC